MQILIVALLPKEIECEVINLSKKYHPKLFSGKDLPPHFTLVMPISIIADLSSIKSNLQQTIEQIRSFNIAIDGIGTFTKNKNVVFYHIVPSKELDNLHRQINKSINQLVDQKSTSHLPFKPHITLAKKMSDEDLQYILSDLDDFHPQHEFNLREIGLYVLEEPKMFWKLAGRYRLIS